jgi:hypothetical protein
LKLWILLLLPLLFFGCRDKVTNPDGDGGGGGTPLSASEGLIRLNVGNWWDYEYSQSSGLLEPGFRRIVRAKVSLHNSEYYLLVDSMRETGRIDTAFYLRNQRDLGVVMLPYPADSAEEDTLFRWPQVHAGTTYWCQQDCVVALYDYPGHTQVEGDSTYHLMLYQTFVNGSQDTTRVFSVSGDSIGILKETNVGAGGRYYTLTGYHLIY